MTIVLLLLVNNIDSFITDSDRLVLTTEACGVAVCSLLYIDSAGTAHVNELTACSTYPLISHLKTNGYKKQANSQWPAVSGAHMHLRVEEVSKHRLMQSMPW